MLAHPSTPISVRRRFVLLTGLRWLPVGFMAPLLVLLFLSRGLSLAEVGVVMACYSAATILLELPTGGLADAVGRRLVLVIASVAHLFFFGSMLVASSLPVWILVAILGGVARALDSGPLEAWYVDETRQLDPGGEIRTGLAQAGSVEGVGLAVSAVAGGLLPTVFGGNLNVAVTAALGTQCLHLVGLLTLMTEHRRRAGSTAAAFRQTPAVVRAGVALGLRQGAVGLLLVGSLTVGVAMAGTEVLWQPRFDDLLGDGSSTALFGALMAGAFLAAALGSGLAPRLARLTGCGSSRAALICALAQAGVYLVLSAAGHVVVAAPAFIVVYVVLGLRNPFHRELLHEHVPGDQRSTMLSATSLAEQGGFMAGSLALPAIAAATSIPLAWAVAAGVTALAALVYVPVPDQPPVLASQPAL